MKGASLTVEDISWGTKSHPDILSPLSFDLAPGRILGIVGPNGAGKSTLLRLLYRFHRPVSGHVRLDGKDIWHLSARAVATKVAAVLQEQTSDFAMTVRDIVSLGRTPHRRGLSGAAPRDEEICCGALEQLQLSHLADRTLNSLSGGEKQRLMVARALAQEPSLLVLDEPTNHLDIRHQLEVLRLIRELGITIVVSLHDLNLAAETCDDLLMLADGKALASGPAQDVLSEERVGKAFEVTARWQQLYPGNQAHLTFHL